MPEKVPSSEYEETENLALTDAVNFFANSLFIYFCFFISNEANSKDETESKNKKNFIKLFICSA